MVEPEVVICHMRAVEQKILAVVLIESIQNNKVQLLCKGSNAMEVVPLKQKSHKSSSTFDRNIS